LLDRAAALDHFQIRLKGLWMRILDRILACILILGGLGHGVGSYIAYWNEPITLLWALSASMLSLLIAAINLLRAGRPTDRPLAWIAFASSLALAISAFTFGVLIGNIYDVRALLNGFAALALAALSVMTALGAHTARA
jgi:hypothetical protein